MFKGGWLVLAFGIGPALGMIFLVYMILKFMGVLV